MSDQFPPPPPPPGQPPVPPVPGGVPAYGQPPAMPKTSTNAVVALVLAIASYVICPLVPAIVALFLASSAEREIAASGGWITGDGLVKAARILSWISIALAILGLLFFLVVFGLAAVSGTSTSTTG